MSLHLTPDILESSYEALRKARPFLGRGLPHCDDLEFRVTRHKDRYGHFGDRDGKNPWTNISISSVCVTTWHELQETMAHEMIHVDLFLRGDPHWHAHGKSFTRRATRVCRELGFNPETF
jgi:hypothetical protein